MDQKMSEEVEREDELDLGEREITERMIKIDEHFIIKTVGSSGSNWAVR